MVGEELTLPEVEALNKLYIWLTLCAGRDYEDIHYISFETYGTILLASALRKLMELKGV